MTSSPLTSLSSLDEMEEDAQFQSSSSSSSKEPLISFDDLRTAQASRLVIGQWIVISPRFKALMRSPQLVFFET